MTLYRAYIKALIDSANLRTAVRAVEWARTLKFLSEFLVEGAEIFAESIAEHAVEDRDDCGSL